MQIFGSLLGLGRDRFALFYHVVEKQVGVFHKPVSAVYLTRNLYLLI